MQEQEELTNEVDRTNQKLITILSRCLQNIHKKEGEWLHESNLTVRQFGVLEILYHNGPQKISDITNLALSSGGNMTVVIDNLEKQKLALRIDDPNDRRAKLVQLTKEGKALIADLFPEYLMNLRIILETLSMSEKKQLIRLATKTIPMGSAI